MTSQIIYSDLARRDAAAIAEYIERNAGPSAAEHFVHRLIAKVETLRLMPGRHRLRSGLQPGLRAVGIAKYLVFYRIADDTVFVVRIVHGARNITPDYFQPGADPESGHQRD